MLVAEDYVQWLIGVLRGCFSLHVRHKRRSDNAGCLDDDYL